MGIGLGCRIEDTSGRGIVDYRTEVVAVSVVDRSHSSSAGGSTCSFY